MRTLEPVKRSNLSAQVMEGIKQYIITNNFTPGTQLPSERDLTEMLGCSRSSIREALKSLEAIGIIEVKVGKGIFVAECTWSSVVDNFMLQLCRTVDTEHLIEARLALELAILDIVVDKATDEDLNALERITDKFKSVQTSEDDVAVDLEFHESLVAISANPLLAELSNLVRGFFAATIGTVPTVAGKPAFVDDHKQLLSAIRSRDKAGSKRIMEQHINAWKGFLTKKQRRSKIS